MSQFTHTYGNSIFLKAGQTFTGTLDLSTAVGKYQTATYDSNLTSNWNSLQTSCNASSRWSDYHTLRTNAGASSAMADADSNYYCKLYNLPAAIIAARDAADTTTPWITVTKYGAGANPILDGVDQTSTLYGIKLSATGGFKISHLELKNYRIAGVRGINLSSIGGGIWLDDISSHDHHNAPGGAVTGEEITTHQGYSIAFGAELLGYPYTFITNSTLDNNDSPFEIGTSTVATGHDVLLDGVNADHSHYLQGLIISGGGRVAVQNGTINHMADLGPGFTDGSAALMFQVLSTDGAIKNMSLLNTTKRTTDGNAFDEEGGVIHLGIFDSTLTGNDGPAILSATTSGENNGYFFIDNCTIGNNAKAGASDATINFINDVHNGVNVTSPQTVIVTRSTITKQTTPAQNFLFASRNIFTQTDTITTWWPNGWMNVTAGDNTVN